MQDIANFELPAPKHLPWNKGKLTGANAPRSQSWLTGRFSWGPLSFQTFARIWFVRRKLKM